MAKRLTAAARRALQTEAREWDALTDIEVARLFDTARPVGVRVRRPPPKSLTVALDRDTLNRLRRVARRKQVRPRQLAAMWIAECLAREPVAARRPRRVA